MRAPRSRVRALVVTALVVAMPLLVLAGSADALAWWCRRYDGQGHGSVSAHGRSTAATGEWYDGCGGDGCDDIVTGTHNGGQGWFQIREFRVNGACRLDCNLDGHTWVASSGQVAIGHAGSGRWVDFGCNQGGAHSFAGHLSNA